MAKEKPTPEKKYTGKYAHLFNKHYSIDDIDQLADEFMEWIAKDRTAYWFNDFFSDPSRMITKDRRLDFCKRSEYFSKIYKIAKDIQEKRMHVLSIQAEKPTAWIFALKNVAGWRDNPEPIDDGSVKKANVNIDEPNSKNV